MNTSVMQQFEFTKSEYIDHMKFEIEIQNHLLKNYTNEIESLIDINFEIKESYKKRQFAKMRDLFVQMELEIYDLSDMLENDFSDGMMYDGFIGDFLYYHHFLRPMDLKKEETILEKKYPGWFSIVEEKRFPREELEN